MEKLINKILDNYYKKQLINKIKSLLFFWCLDYKFVERTEGFELQVKKKEYKDELFKSIAFFGKNNYLYYLIDWKEVLEKIKNAIEEYEKIKY